MATKNGIVSSPDSGSGQGTLSFKAQVISRGNRVIQSATFNVSGVGVADVTAVNVRHEAAAEFVTFDVATKSVDKDGGNITLTGKTNSAKLTFSLGTLGQAQVILPPSYSAGGQNTNNGANIDGDPGASSQFTFSITLEVAENTTTEALTRQVIATANGGQTSTCELQQSQAQPYLTVTPIEITIPQDGSAVSVTIDSNTNWTVS